MGSKRTRELGRDMLLAASIVKSSGPKANGRNRTVLRVDAGSPPARLQHIAERAAQAGDLRSMHPTDHTAHTSAQWDELRGGEPGD